MARRPTVSIIGVGSAGGAIGLALRDAGYTVAATWSRSRAGRQRASRMFDAPVLPEPSAVAAAADVTIVAVPDDAIAPVGAELAPGVRSGCYVIHTSGGVTIEALGAARTAGARVGSLHPLQTLPGPRPEVLRGAAVAVTCGLEDRNVLFRLARAWGGRPFNLPDESKVLYHAAAVLASNDVVTSLWAASVLLRSIGVRDARSVLAPLVEATIRNVLADGPENAITGPVVRGDTQAVRRHVEALKKEDPTAGRIVDAYRALARLTADLAGADDPFAKAKS